MITVHTSCKVECSCLDDGNIACWDPSRYTFIYATETGILIVVSTISKKVYDGCMLYSRTHILHIRLVPTTDIRGS